MSSASTPLVIVGAGGLGRETAEAVKAMNRVAPTYALLGYVDDHHADYGAEVDGLPLLGPIDEITSREDVHVVVCTGSQRNNFSRRRIVERLDLPPERYAVIVHPGASVAETCTIGPGTVILAGNVLTAAVTVGSHVAVMPGCVLTHDDVIGDYVTMASGVLCGGNAVIETGAFVGMGAIVREGRRVGAWSLVGAAAQVTRDVEPGEVVIGNPARVIRRLTIPDDLR